MRCYNLGGMNMLDLTVTKVDSVEGLLTAMDSMQEEGFYYLPIMHYFNESDMIGDKDLEKSVEVSMVNFDIISLVLRATKWFEVTGNKKPLYIYAFNDFNIFVVVCEEIYENYSTTEKVLDTIQPMTPVFGLHFGLQFGLAYEEDTLQFFSSLSDYYTSETPPSNLHLEHFRKVKPNVGTNRLIGRAEGLTDSTFREVVATYLASTPYAEKEVQKPWLEGIAHIDIEDTSVISFIQATSLYLIADTEDKMTSADWLLHGYIMLDLNESFENLYKSLEALKENKMEELSMTGSKENMGYGQYLQVLRSQKLEELYKKRDKIKDHMTELSEKEEAINKVIAEKEAEKQKEADEIREIAQKSLDSYNAYVDLDAGDRYTVTKTNSDGLMFQLLVLPNKELIWRNTRSGVTPPKGSTGILSGATVWDALFEAEENESDDWDITRVTF